MPRFCIPSVFCLFSVSKLCWEASVHNWVVGPGGQEGVGGGGGAGGLVREKEEAEYVSEYSKPLRRKDIEAGTDMVDSRAEGWRCT